MMTKEASTKIVNVMTPWGGLVKIMYNFDDVYQYTAQ